MSTEYRRGIPSTAYVEAATRLGLLWQQADAAWREWRFEVRGRDIWCDFAPWDPRGLACLTEDNRVISPARAMGASWRPIRPESPRWLRCTLRGDGTPVDWEVLDQEVARVGQQGQPQTMTCNLTAPEQPQGFRADLWSRICIHFSASMLDRSIKDVVIADAAEGLIVQGRQWSWNTVTHGATGRVAPEAFERATRQRADILARWTVYQELKPLYDLVDGAQGEVTMPRDVEAEWFTAATMPVPASGRWFLCHDTRGIHTRNDRYVTWRPEEVGYGGPLRNFAAVLDAVAERRVAERMQGQTPANPNAILTVTSAQRSNVEPRRFADVRPDRHGWRWWRLVSAPGCTAINGSRFEAANEQWRWLAMADGAAPTGPLVGSHIWTHVDSIWNLRTVIPTDEQGNSVSWEAAGFAAEAMRFAQETVQRAANDAIPSRSAGDIEWTLPRPSQFSNNPATPPLTPEGFQQVLETVQMAPGLYQETLDWVTRQVLAGPVIGVDTAKAPPITTLPLPLPRFTADELDDVDHSKTTKLDEVMLRRGKLPTVEQIAKYREVRTKRTGGAVADALKESRIDCEVAQYVLERWAGGLGDELALWLLRAVGKYSRSDLRFTQRSVDELAQRELTHEAGAIETAESSPAVQRERLEAEERRQRLTELRQRLAAERAAQPQETAKESDVSRFDLIEPDPQADPSASIRAWEARQAATKVCHTAAPPRIAKPAAAPRRPAIEVVDAEVDGLSRSEAFAALFGRALNGGC